MYIVYKKNIHLTPSRLAHEVATLAVKMGLTVEDKLVVLGASTKKFREFIKAHPEAEIHHLNCPMSAVPVATCAGTEEPLRIKI